MFQIKQFLKMFLQNALLPLIYAWYARRPVRKGSVLFADGHHEEIPFSMRRMYEALADSGLQVQVCVRDFGRMSWGALFRYLIWFMKQYATSEYVFVCDYYLPASCRKRKETTLVQLWHSCGLMKKIAYDAGDDIPKHYRGDMFGNYTYLTLSAPVCVPVHAKALRMPQERIRATGISRTDYYFDREWNRRCREQFYRRYPQAKGKKIALWAPTFRGNAAMPRLEGLEAVQAAAAELSDEWYFILKAHPHIDAHTPVSNCEIPTEELLTVADVLITDYSSILFDYLLYRKPAVLFAPDLEQYVTNRGFYLDYRSIPYPLTQTVEELTAAVRACGREWENQGSDEQKRGTRRLEIQKSDEQECEAQELEDLKQKKQECGAQKKTRRPEGQERGDSIHINMEEIDQFRELYVGACDGHATQRILELVGLGAYAKK